MTKQTLIITIVLLAGVICFPTTAVQARTVNFSGYDWQVKSGHNAPGPNYWNDSTSGVSVDTTGKLHLFVTNVAGQWKSSEVYLDKSFGYGTYEFVIESRVDLIDKNLIAAPFLYADDTRELDIEFTRWGVEDGDNLLFSVQPTTGAAPTNEKTILLPAITGVTTNKIEWTGDYIRFSVYEDSKKLAGWEYNGQNNFIPGNERVHINFWQLNGKAPASGKTEEIIFKSFSFKPLSVISPPIIPSTQIPTTPPAVSSTIISLTTTVKNSTTTISNTVFSTTTKTEQALKKKITALEKEITKLKADLKKANTKINNLLAKIKQCLKWPKKK